jgi:uncharacterized protein
MISQAIGWHSPKMTMSRDVVAMFVLRVLHRLIMRKRAHMSARAVFRSVRHPKENEETAMTIAADLLQRHIQTLVADNEQWQTLIADDLVWELPYAPTLGHPARLSGREEVVGFVTWFLGAVENFRFFDLTVYPCADPDVAVAEVKAEARIKPTGRRYRQEYVVFLRAAGGKIAFLREYFNPVRAAQAMDAPILELES